MNVLINFLYKEGAGPVFSLEMARGLADNGCNVYAIVSDKISNKEEWENEDKIKQVYFIDTGTRKNAISSTVKFLLYKHKNISEFFKNIKFDYVVQTFFHPWANRVSNQVDYKKLLTICHDPILHSGVKKFEIVQTQNFIKKSDEIIVLTEKFIEIVEDKYGFERKKIHFMPHGRMGDYKKNQNKSLDLRYDKNKLNFLFFGRIEEYKGLRVLAEAYKKLSEENENVTLTIAGSGDFSKYEEDFKDILNVTIINRYIKDEEVGSFFDGSNVVTILPYLDATQSGVIPIALEYNTPIIASDTGGIREQLNNGRIGILFNSGDSTELYEKMKQLIVNKEIISEEKKKMYGYLECLEWKVVTKKLLESLKNNKGDYNI